MTTKEEIKRAEKYTKGKGCENCKYFNYDKKTGRCPYCNLGYNKKQTKFLNQLKEVLKWINKKEQLRNLKI